MNEFFGFPDPVNETSARIVAGGVVAMATATVALDQPWILFPLTYGFAARVATGPKLSPLGQIATRLITPRLRVRHRYSPGSPKRLAQGMGLAMSGAAMAAYYGFGRKRLAYGLLTGLAAAASLESLAGFCVVCRLYSGLVSLGLLSEAVCERCTDPDLTG